MELEPELRLRAVLAALLVAALFATTLPAPFVAAQEGGDLGVQQVLEAQPGALKGYREDGRSATEIIESAALFYGLSPRLHLALLEATAGLLSNPAPPDAALRQPFGPAGPDGFAAQIDWASRELRAGLGPYERPPTLRFSDGLTLTLTLEQAPEGVAVQRFLATGRTLAGWRAVVERFNQAFAAYFNNELVQSGPPALGASLPSTGDGVAPAPANAPGGLTLLQPWPAGVRVVHLAYFDHAYPTVDSGDDGNGVVVNHLGQGNVQYDGHDGHDYYFPDRPIGTPILAAAAGMAYARTRPDNGVVIVHPGGYETIYWHLGGFAPIFEGRINTSQGLPVAAGAFLGVSGPSRVAGGTPHLHFEVRRFGKQIDPYGWFGPGPDPCAAYAGCLPGEWLWAPSLIGAYDFTPPGITAPLLSSQLPRPDQTPPSAAISIAPPDDLLFAVEFDGHPVQRVGRGFPQITGTPRFGPGYAGQALDPGPAEVAYPLAGNLDLRAGTVSLWAELPERYPGGAVPRHYLFAASANPDGAPVYSHTLALRRDASEPDGGPAWVFWTTGSAAASRDLLAAPDTLGAGWHHLAITWDAEGGHKALYLDGVLVARAQGVALPTDVGEVLRLGRFAAGGGHSGVRLDELMIFNRALDPAEIAALAEAPSGASEAVVRLRERTVRIDTNALDDQGGIMAVQFGLNGIFEDPQPYYDAYRWTLPVSVGRHILAVRFSDRWGNTTTLTRTIQLDGRQQVFLPLLR